MRSDEDAVDEARLDDNNVQRCTRVKRIVEAKVKEKIDDDNR